MSDEMIFETTLAGRLAGQMDPIKVRAAEHWPQLPPLIVCPHDEPFPCGRVAWPLPHAAAYRCAKGHDTAAKAIWWKVVAPARRMALRRMMGQAIQSAYGDGLMEVEWLS